MTYDDLARLLTTTFAPPPPISAASDAALIAGADALVDWCNERLVAVPAECRVNSAAALASERLLISAAYRVRTAATREIAERAAQHCAMHAAQVASAASADRERVVRELRRMEVVRAAARARTERN